MSTSGTTQKAPARFVRSALSLFNFLHPRRDIAVRVLLYHGVVEHKIDPLLERNFHLLDDFRSHLRSLQKYRVLSLAELSQELRSPKKTQRGPAAVITFDDAYANNRLAAEVLSEYRLPWTLFVPTGAVGRDNYLWTSELSLLLLHGEAAGVELLGNTWSLKGRSEREFAFETIRRVLKTMLAELRKMAMNSLRRQFPGGETSRLLNNFRSMQMLSWEEIRHLRDTGVEIGSHGVDHEIHHGNQPQAVRLFELTESKAILEERLGDACRFFAFPNGDFARESAEEVRRAGYDLGFTAESGIVSADTNPCLLPRIDPADSGPLLIDNLPGTSRQES